MRIYSMSMHAPSWLALAFVTAFILSTTWGPNFGRLQDSPLPQEVHAQVSTNLTWTESASPQRPPAVAEHSMAYDAKANRILLFGGYANQPTGETWAYDPVGDAWTNRTTAQGPPARSLAAMAYDAESDRVILFGGAHVGSNLDDTWSYDYDSNTWTNLNPVVRPIGRTGHAMTYDNRSDRVILFGGYSAVAPLGETWSFDFNRDNWTQLNPAVSPSSRGLNAIVYDHESDRVIMFGGSVENPGSSVVLFKETWTYDFGGNVWRRMNPFLSPSARAWHGMAYDSATDRTVLFGGIDENGSNGETWFYDLNRDLWIRATPLVSPSPRTGHALAYEVQPDRIILFGGRAPGGTSNETWALGPVLPDTTPPILRVDAPTEGAVIGSSSLFVQGTASDDRAVARVEVQAGSSDWVLATGTAKWSLVLTLGLGQIAIHVRATDTSGNVASVTVGVTVLPAGTVALIITSIGLTGFAVWFAWHIREKRKRDPLHRYRRA